MASSPTQRSLALLRKHGWTAAVVEHWNHHVKRRVDLFGFADIIAVDADGRRIMLVQTTSASNFAARRTKCQESEHAATWLAAGGEILIHGWRKKDNGRWECREEYLHEHA
jgi:hypothetical protein